MKLFLFITIFIFNSLSFKSRAESVSVESVVDLERVSWEVLKECAGEGNKNLEYLMIENPKKAYERLNKLGSISGKFGLGYYYYSNSRYAEAIQKYNEAIYLVNKKRADHIDLGFKYTEKNGSLRLIGKKTVLRYLNSCIQAIKKKIK